MTKAAGSLILLFALFSVSQNCFAQDYQAMIQQQLQQGNALANQMQQMEGGIVQQNMQNPQVQQMYQNYINNGGTASFQQFAYSYAATGGFTPEGRQIWNQNEARIQRNEQQAVQRYRDNQAQNYQAMQQMNQRNDEIARARGNLLNGTTDYYQPGTNNQYNLPHTLQPNNYYYDQGSGQNFYRDPQGNYQRQGQDGYWYGLQEEE